MHIQEIFYGFSLVVIKYIKPIENRSNLCAHTFEKPCEASGSEELYLQARGLKWWAIMPKKDRRQNYSKWDLEGVPCEARVERNLLVSNMDGCGSHPSQK